LRQQGEAFLSMIQNYLIKVIEIHFIYMFGLLQLHAVNNDLFAIKHSTDFILLFHLSGFITTIHLNERQLLNQAI